MLMSWSELSTVVVEGANAGLHTLLYGPPGTGKTRVATVPGCYSVTMTAETPAAEIRGHFVPKGTEFIWHDGPGLRGWRKGSRIVINEIDCSSGDALTFLNALLDDPEVARITLPTGETVTPTKGFHAVATMNGLPSDLPASLRDRFIPILVDIPHPEALQRLSASLSQAVTDTIALDDNRKVSLRQALAYTRLSSALGVELASRAVFGSRATDIRNSLILGDK